MRAAGRDNVRMAHTHDAIVLAIRAIREGFHVLRALGYPIVPKSVANLARIPEPLLVRSLQKRPPTRGCGWAMLEHAQAAQTKLSTWRMNLLPWCARRQYLHQSWIGCTLTLIPPLLPCQKEVLKFPSIGEHSGLGGIMLGILILVGSCGC